MERTGNGSREVPPGDGVLLSLCFCSEWQRRHEILKLRCPVALSVWGVESGLREAKAETKIRSLEEMLTICTAAATVEVKARRCEKGSGSKAGRTGWLAGVWGVRHRKTEDESSFLGWVIGCMVLLFTEAGSGRSRIKSGWDGGGKQWWRVDFGTFPYEITRSIYGSEDEGSRLKPKKWKSLLCHMSIHQSLRGNRPCMYTWYLKLKADESVELYSQDNCHLLMIVFILDFSANSVYLLLFYLLDISISTHFS